MHESEQLHNPSQLQRELKMPPWRAGAMSNRPAFFKTSENEYDRRISGPRKANELYLG